MFDVNSMAAIFADQDQTEHAIKTLQASGIALMVGRGFRSEQDVVSFCTAGDRMKAWGGSGALWGGMWGLLFGSAFFWVPGAGAVTLAGPIVPWIIGALQGALVVGGLSALGAAIYSIGIPNGSIVEYETVLKTGKVVVVVDDTSEDVKKVQYLPRRISASQMALHLNTRATV